MYKSSHVLYPTWYFLDPKGSMRGSFTHVIFFCGHFEDIFACPLKNLKKNSVLLIEGVPRGVLFYGLESGILIRKLEILLEISVAIFPFKKEWVGDKIGEHDL